MEAREAAVGHDFAGDVVQLVQLAADQHHMRAQRRQLVRDAAADARTAAGDDDHLALERPGGKHGTVVRASCSRRSADEKCIAASVSSSSVAPLRRSYHWADQFSAPKISRRASFTSALSWPLACSASSTGTQGASYSLCSSASAARWRGVIERASYSITGMKSLPGPSSTSKWLRIRMRSAPAASGAAQLGALAAPAAAARWPSACPPPSRRTAARPCS